MDTDLNMLKSITEQVAIKAQPGGRFDAAEEAVENVLRVLYETAQSKELWGAVYDAVKRAYVAEPDWGEQ